ncbi:hypothetical protein LINPERPRIM_LOCUS39598 [Linum perenne]
MATATQTLTHRHHHLPKPKSSSSTTKLQVCFSFAAYAKKLIHHLNSLHVPILPGLTDSEFSDLESTFKFSFPPDLRSILQEGIPFGLDFPNWRSSASPIFLNAPILNLSTNIRRRRFWAGSWGDRPGNRSELNAAVKKLLECAPVLVPIYTNCYIPASPTAAGNPVFYVDEETVRIMSFDIAGFFQNLDINPVNSTAVTRRIKAIALPAWAATAAREIEFWTDAAENGKRIAATADTATNGWWVPGELTECMEDVFWRLRDGGWTEDEVREMMMMDGCDLSRNVDRTVEDDEEEVRHVRMMSAGDLLRAGWSREDVVYSLDLHDCDRTVVEEGKSSVGATFDFQVPTGFWRQGCGAGGDRRRRRSLGDFISVHSVELEVL